MPRSCTPRLRKRSPFGGKLLAFLLPSLGVSPLLLLALLVGLVLGWLIGWLQGRAVLRAYRAGVQDERSRGGGCWVRGEAERRGGL